MSHETHEKWPFCGIATRRGQPEGALSYFISPFVKPPLAVQRDDPRGTMLPDRPGKEPLGSGHVAPSTQHVLGPLLSETLTEVFG